MSEHPPEPVVASPPSPKPPRSGWRRAGRVLLLILLGLLGLVLVAVIGGLLWLHTGRASGTLGRLATAEVKNALAGNLQIAGIEVRGFLDVCVDGVELSDPDGHKVLSAKKLCLHVNPVALKANKVQLSKVQVVEPWIELAIVPGKTPGTTTTTLANALAPRKDTPSKPSSGPFAWKIDVADLKLTDGSLTMRPALGAPATFAIEALDITQAHARYAADSAAAGLQLSADLTAPGATKVNLQLDASLEGALSTGTADVKTLNLKLGESTLSAKGSWDLGRQAGELHLRGLRVLPKDLETLLPGKQSPIASEVRGEADVKSDGKTASVDLRLQAGGGNVNGKITATLDKVPVWDLQLAVDKVDPSSLAPLAPKGQVSGLAALHGKGRPEFDGHGVKGELQGQVHLGPARLERVGDLVFDLSAQLHGRYAIIKTFTATALGLKIRAKGAAGFDELSIDLDVDAPDLAHVGRAIGGLTKKPSLPIAGALKLNARVTGSLKKPDAEVHLRAPLFRFGPTLLARGLAVDGVLQGPLDEPDGELSVHAQSMVAGTLDLGASRVDLTLEYPLAHLRIDAGVNGGALTLAGDATIDDDRDGLVLSRFIVAYPGNELHLAHDTNVHFRDEVVVEPLELTGDHGSLRFSAQVRPKTAKDVGRTEAALVISKLELDRLPAFALPKDLGLHGVLDATAVVSGPPGLLDVDLLANLKGAGAAKAGALALDAHTHAHLHGGELRTDGWVAAPGIVRLSFDGDVPATSIASLPLSTPLRLGAQVEQADLGKLADALKLAAAQKQKLRGLLDVRVVASGTLGAPRATVSLTAKELGTNAVEHVGVTAGVLLEKGQAVLDGRVALQESPAVGFTARTPFDLSRALREPGYLRGALGRAASAEVAISDLQLERLAAAKLLPEGSAGKVSLSLRAKGTLAKPAVQLSASGTDVSFGRLQKLGFQSELVIDDHVRFGLGAQSQGDVVARLDVTAALTGAEVVEVVMRRDEPDAIASLLDRAVTLVLEVPGLPIARASQLAGSKKTIAEGKIVGRVTLTGTPARPRLVAKIAIDGLKATKTELGKADVYVEADDAGALMHLGIDPPGGGQFLGHAQLTADLGARTLLRDGVLPILDGNVSGEVNAKQLDLGFLSGLAPTLRHAGGKLDASAKLSGQLGKPSAEGEAHLRRGVFDVVGQGVFEDVSLDSTYSPKEVVIDRLTGSTGTGTFSAVIVAARRPAPQAAAGDKIEFTGEVHLGDDESARDRKLPDGKPVRKGAVPVRQAGEERADVTAELDVFGDLTDNFLNVNAKIPDARVVIKQLPNKKLPSLKENPDVLLVHAGERPHPPGKEPEEADAEAKAIRQATFRMHAHLDLVHLYVKAPDFEFPVESDLNFDYDAKHPGDPTADGSVHVPQGSFSALGRRFTIEDARIVETGGEIADPELEIKARYENPKATVQINISGTAMSPLIEMSSNPPMDQDAIAFFLATGRIEGRATQSGGGVDLSSAATSVLGGVLFGQLRQELANVLPVDVLTIETGSTGVSQASVGKYIGDRVFIGYRQRLTPAPNENTSEGRIEYEISKNVGAEATVGDKNSDLSVLYTTDF